MRRIAEGRLVPRLGCEGWVCGVWMVIVRVGEVASRRGFYLVSTSSFDSRETKDLGVYHTEQVLGRPRKAVKISWSSA